MKLLDIRGFRMVMPMMALALAGCAEGEAPVAPEVHAARPDASSAHVRMHGATVAELRRAHEVRLATEVEALAERVVGAGNACAMASVEVGPRGRVSRKSVVLLINTIDRVVNMPTEPYGGQVAAQPAFHEGGELAAVERAVRAGMGFDDMRKDKLEVISRPFAGSSPITSCHTGNAMAMPEAPMASPMAQPGAEAPPMAEPEPLPVLTPEPVN